MKRVKKIKRSQPKKKTQDENPSADERPIMQQQDNYPPEMIQPPKSQLTVAHNLLGIEPVSILSLASFRDHL
jgi:hypothetical protein